MRNSKNRPSRWPKIRKLLNDIHLWGGLLAGIIVFIVCLTGTIYVYNTEIRELAQPKYYKINQQGERQDLDTLLAQVKPAVQGKIVGIKIPFANNKPTFILYTKPTKDKPTHAEPQKNAERAKKQQSAVTKPQGAPSAGRGPRANQLAVNPYTSKIIGDPSDEKSATAEFMQKMFGLHRWLLLNEIEKPIFEGIENRKLGSWIIGTATLLFLLGVLTGIVIWFPIKMRGWKNGLKIKWRAKWKRLNHDLHNTLGFYSFIILFLMSVTGPFWSFEWYREGWQKMWGTYENPKAAKEEKTVLSSTLINTKTKMSIEEIIIATNKILPYNGDITINFAKDSIGTVSVSKNKIGFFAPAAGDRLTLDQYSGAVLKTEIFKEKSFNERAAASIKALHIGDVYGPFTKLLYFIASIIATSLPVTGTFIWINKMKKKPQKIKKS